MMNESVFIPNANSDSADEPSLRIHLNIGNVHALPEFSEGPRLPEGPELYAAIKAAGYDGIQHYTDYDAVRAAGLEVTGMSRVNQPGDALRIVDEARTHGVLAMTLHVGTGFEPDAEVLRIVEDIVSTAHAEKYPIYVETHRATITQDIWRTVQMALQVPGVRFNGDFSHWYTGHELTYGDLEWKWSFIAPVFDRVRFIHGRIGNGGSMQVDVGNGKGGEAYPFVDHFREMWTRSFVGFLKSAKPGDFIVFSPELLQSSIYYARVFREAGSGVLREETDRWSQAAVLCNIAREAFAEAQSRTGSGR